jgi:hypothetical protein
MKKIAILQSNYLPWKGVFDLIHRVDTFVFLEDVQYTTGDWRNRNQILTPSGLQWISVPVKHIPGRKGLIMDMEIDNSADWQKAHFNALRLNYARAAFFKEYQWILADLFLERKWERLTDLNRYSTKLIADILGVNTEFVDSADLLSAGRKDDKLIDICLKLKGDYYLSGPSAQNYLVPEKFAANRIILDYIEYKYPEYPQLHRPFVHNVTVLDLIFNCGPQASHYIWGWRDEVS